MIRKIIQKIKDHKGLFFRLIAYVGGGTIIGYLIFTGTRAF